LKARGLLPSSIRRVAIIGPGLDFVDKDVGYDFYPVQSLQPFAVIDTLLRLDLARIDQLEITTLDVSRRVNDHLRRARSRAQSGAGYTLQLPLDPTRNWTSEARAFWKRFGDQVGIEIPPVPLPAALKSVMTRAVRVDPRVVRHISPENVNIVLQRLERPSLDLIVATNVFVYYDLFEQSLAAANVRAMLASEGLLLSNNILLELPALGLKSVGYLGTTYSDRRDDGDYIVWYRPSSP
ncbi:MAG: hypothetical protein ACRD1T_22465, partial [Acidimicrobiia bacterium]